MFHWKVDAGDNDTDGDDMGGDDVIVNGDDVIVNGNVSMCRCVPNV